MLRPWLRKQFRPNVRPIRRRPVNLNLLALEDRVVPSSPGQQIDHVIVIYQENWSFDSLYGSFPGANGIANASPTSLTQIDRLTGQPLANESTFNRAYTSGPSTLQNPPPPLNGSLQVDTRFLTNPADPSSPAAVNTLQPYNVARFLSPNQTTGDIVHRYWQEQSQINGGAQNGYVTWSDNPGLVMSYFDATNLPEGLLAQQYTMDDNFFHAAYGGSFLNAQFLVAAAAPVYPNAPGSLQPVLAADGQLALDPVTGKIIQDGNVTPVNGTFDRNYAVNTIFSRNLVPVGTSPASTGLLPSQNDSNPNDPTRPYIPTIGDRLDNAGVSWKWYSGGWDAALASSPSNPHPFSPATVDPLFQWHHQALAYYDNFAPWLPDGERNPLSAAHLQDELSFFQDLAGGNLPSVSFIKPVGTNNEHPGYTDLLRGQQHVADIVHAVQNSPEWAHTAVVITYDENGGRWDHVSPPDANGIWGDGTRVPALVISPYAKQGYVDHAEHDTLSILSSIEKRFNLQPLNQYDAQASTLADDFQGTPQVSIGKAYLQPDADNPGRYTLIVQGTEGNDQILITKSGTAIRVRINGDGVNYDHYFDTTYQSISRMEVYTQGGDDYVAIGNAVTIPAQVFTGGGNDYVRAGGGSTVVVGGGGSDALVGGAGRAILIGGAGKAWLYGGGGDTLFIAGTTAFDANAEALRALQNEWSRADQSYGQRAADLTNGGAGALNGAYLLNASSVTDSGAGDRLYGGAGTDLFFAHAFGKGKKDRVTGLTAGELFIEI